MKTKINNKKVLYKCGRILCNERHLSFESLNSMIRSYINHMNLMKKIYGITIDQSKMNYGVKFLIFDINVTVGKLFELYNEIAAIEGFTTYSKLWYNPDQSVKICPS